MITTQSNQNPIVANASSEPRSPLIQKSDYPANVEDLYLTHLPRVISLASSRGVSDPENFAQEVLIKALRGFNPALSRFEQRLSFLMRCAFSDEFKTRSRFDTVPLDEAAFEASAEPEVADSDVNEKLHLGLSQLRPSDRALIHQRFWKERTIQEIIRLPEFAGRGLKPHRVKTSYGRALAGLRNGFQDRFSLSDSDDARRACGNLKRPRTPSPKVPPARRKNSRPSCEPKDIQ